MDIVGIERMFIRITQLGILFEEIFQVPNNIVRRLAMHWAFVMPGPRRALRDGLHTGGLYIALWM